MAKRKNPQDLTLRNLRALRKDLAIEKRERRFWVRRLLALERSFIKLLTRVEKLEARAGLVVVLLLGALASPAQAQTSASIVAKTCMLTMSADKSPDGTSGWSVQFKRNADNQGTKDTSAPYGPKSAIIAAGTYVLTAVWTQTGKPTITEQVGTAKCEGGSLLVVVPLPPPPSPPPTTGASPDGTLVPPAASLTDSAGHIWTLGAAPDNAPTLRYVLCDGHPAESGYASAIRYLAGVVSTRAADQQWYVVACGSGPVVDDGGSASPPPVSQPGMWRLGFNMPNPTEYAALVTRVVLRLTDASGMPSVMELGKPSADATGAVTVPIALAVTGRYQASVGVCSDVGCAYSPETSVVF